MRRVIPNILEDIHYVTEETATGQRYGADLLGRALGHEIQASGGYVTGIMVVTVPAVNQFTVSQQCMTRAAIADVMRDA